MKRTHALRSAIAAAAVLLTAGAADAATWGFSLTGTGVSGSFVLTYGTATDATYPAAFEVTGITGSFTDTNDGLGIVDAVAGAPMPVNHATPEPGNLLAPHDFSRFVVTTGLEHGSLSFDNLLWPAGSPQTASDYPFHGGFLDIYGLLFSIGGGRYVNIWSNGVLPTGVLDYGVAVVTADQALGYTEGGLTATVTPVPEPATAALAAAGLFGVLAWKRRMR